MSEIVGDTSHLHTKTVPFNAVHKVTGSSGTGSFDLATCTGFKQLCSARATVKVLGDALSCEIIGPASPDKATEAYIGVIPDTAEAFPTEPEHILTIGGSAYVQQSLYIGVRGSSLRFSAEANHQIKPKPMVGSLPKVIYHFKVEGGNNQTVAFIRISGVVEVDGIGFTQTW